MCPAHTQRLTYRLPAPGVELVENTHLPMHRRHFLRSAAGSLASPSASYAAVMAATAAMAPKAHPATSAKLNSTTPSAARMRTPTV